MEPGRNFPAVIHLLFGQFLGELECRMKRYGPLEIILGLLVAALVANVFAQVVVRYVTYQPLAGTEEIARLLFIWICLLGAAIGAKRGTHFAVNFGGEVLPRTVVRI